MMNKDLLKTVKKTSPKIEEIEIDGYGKVTVQKLTATQVIEATRLSLGPDGKTDQNKMGAMLLRVTTYGLGWGLADEASLDEHPALVMAVSPVAMRLSGMSDQAKLKNA